MRTKGTYATYLQHKPSYSRGENNYQYYFFFCWGGGPYHKYSILGPNMCGFRSPPFPKDIGPSRDWGLLYTESQSGAICSPKGGTVLLAETAWHGSPRLEMISLQRKAPHAQPLKAKNPESQSLSRKPRNPKPYVSKNDIPRKQRLQPHTTESKPHLLYQTHQSQ